MSSASKTVNIKFMGKSGTYTAMIQCPSGDLYQEYQRNGDQVMVTPDFTKTKVDFDIRETRNQVFSDERPKATLRK